MKKKCVEKMSSQSAMREFAKHYIPLSESDKKAMLDRLGLNSLDDLFSHIPQNIKFSDAVDNSFEYEEVRTKINEIASKNKSAKISFLGDSLTHWSLPNFLTEICNIRGLTTAYTPYQPERSQGTLITHWIYECALSMLTGFEAINCSLYDRATALYEAITCASRLKRKFKAVIASNILPCDIEVIKTLTKHTSIELIFVRTNPRTSKVDKEELKIILGENKDVSCFAFSQVNSFGVLENVDELTDIASNFDVKSIAIIDPMLLGAGGLKSPSKFGEKGVDIIVGEGQHLYSSPSFGGPGLGIFGVRFNEKNRNDIRQAAGRFVGKAKDESGRDCHVMVLSTREQHIRKEKATSNICSNQAFMATLAGASLIARGDDGMKESLMKAKGLAHKAFEKICGIEGFSYPFTHAEFFNEFVIDCPMSPKILIEKATEMGIHLGVDVSSRSNGWMHLLKFSFTDLNSENDIEKLIVFLEQFSSEKVADSNLDGSINISDKYLGKDLPNIPRFAEEYLLGYYRKLGDINISPDIACYPLGSCTMKYNPYLNDELAGLEGFLLSHPQSPESEVQGSLEILWEFSERIKKITGLEGVAMQSVAGAQGELCALKMFQSWHADNSESVRDIILIPTTAHGTNFASAAVAGFEEKNVIQIKAATNGQLCLLDLAEKLSQYAGRVSCIMVTNPNTSGIFETNFRKIADMVHDAGGLVYMDGANYNAIAGRVNLKAMGVDAMHNNLHKTWSISHGGGGPGDAFVAVDLKLVDYIPSYVIEKVDGKFSVKVPKRSIGSIHRNFGNFAHKVRALAYIMRLGDLGVQAMSGTSVLSARYLFEVLKGDWESLPILCENEPRMHEFILTLSEADFESYKVAGVAKPSAVSRTGKLFLDYGFHAPTVAFPEVFGLMIEPTESYTKVELDRFADAVKSIHSMIKDNADCAARSPRFTPIDRIDEVSANRNPILSEVLKSLPTIPENRTSPEKLSSMSISEISDLIKNTK